jgi:ferritin-like metal-binding protein YciE
MPLENLEDLFHNELRDILSAEKQLLKALPRMAKAAASGELKVGFEEHLAQTEAQVERLDRVFQLIDKTPRAKTCKAMEGLIEEGSEIIEEDAEPAVKDAALIAAAQKVEHYEIATYGTLVCWAKQLGLDAAVDLLSEILAEEKETDEKLSGLAEGTINQQAATADEGA